MRLAITIEVNALPKPEAAELQSLVTQADFFRVRETLPERVIPDGFLYTLTIEDNQQARTLQLTDPTIPEKIRPLLDNLSHRGRSHPGA